MTIRFKILALAFVILVVFGAVVGISTWLQHQFMNQIVAITRYHIPLRTLIADFDVRTDRYEMIILRLLRQPAFIQNEFEATKSKQCEIRPFPGAATPPPPHAQSASASR